LEISWISSLLLKVYLIASMAVFGGRGRGGTGLEPGAGSAVHRGAFVGVFLAGGVEDDAGDVVLAAELDLPDE
jgi:hypothetical protein